MAGEGCSGGKRDNKKVYEDYRIKINKERPNKQFNKHPQFGQPSPMSAEKVPLYRDLLLAFLYTSSSMRLKYNLKQNPPASEVAESLAWELEMIAGFENNKGEHTRKVKRKTEMKLEANKVSCVFVHWRKRKSITKNHESILCQSVSVFLEQKLPSHSEQSEKKICDTLGDSHSDDDHSLRSEDHSQLIG